MGESKGNGVRWQKAKTPAAPTDRGFLFSRLERSKGEPVVDFSKLIRELRLMIKQLPDWKFIMLWLVLFIAAIGYLIGQIRWW
ncbi:hypothetical protein F0M37_24090 [Salmonella enterica subsp. enterica]|nr:hypothetical protein [Salmonella enterica subsp. salamae]EBN9929262.1 hypothetical protein [Salmonella enterica]EBV5179210.1 hypothetical protein [Salmonella enterica subsp. enterica serovar Carmel]EBV5687973.1 hypothetical protein [Salmonella enterica subsp. enterica serovar Typhimurium]EBW9943350.1 hypothetical protein [Salmonella enterica subsp. enterica serovar Give]ECA2175735.1 hypothetical protein [Salmonella enterica subsp. enterica serovar Kisangani]ECD3769737.1 hypothetical protei